METRNIVDNENTLFLRLNQNDDDDDNIIKEELNACQRCHTSDIDKTTIKNGEHKPFLGVIDSHPTEQTIVANGFELETSTRDVLHSSLLRDGSVKKTELEVSSERENTSVKYKGFYVKRKYRLALYFLSYFFSGCAFSIFSPFFPQAAAKKGISLTLTGFVFSIFELMLFITSPFFGTYMVTIGPKFTFLSGSFAGGMCTILFGTLDKSPPGTPFIVSSILCRSVEAIGFSAYTTSIMTFVSTENRKSAATYQGLLQGAFAVGQMVGPIIGGALYELGGFGLPFYVLGGLVLAEGVLFYVIISPPEIEARTKTVSRLTLLCSPLVLVGSICLFTCSSAYCIMNPTLAKHLESFGLSISAIGLLFVILPFAFTIGSPLFGYLCDKKFLHREIIVMGMFVFGVGFLFIGPSNILLPFLPLQLWVVTIGLVIVGISFGGCLSSAMKCLVNGAVDMGFQENTETYALVSGLLRFIYSLGAFLGPVVGGALVQEHGFSKTFTYAATLNILASILVSLILIIHHRQSTNSSNLAIHLKQDRNEDVPKDETTSLIRSEQRI